MQIKKIVHIVQGVILAALLSIPVWIWADTPEHVDFLIGGLTDSSGDPLAGGKVYTYEAGTTTPKATYQDAAKATPHANPVVLDAQGKKQVYADGNYKFRIDSSADVTQYTLDNLRFGKDGGAGSYAGATTGAGNAYVATLTPTLLALTNGTRITFEANHTNTGAATLNVNSLGAIDLNKADDTAVTANEIISGQTYTAVYEASTNAWLLQTVSAPNWTSWTPTLSAGGTMTYTSTSITFASYYKVGKLVFFRAAFTGTVGGTPSTTLRFTLPVTSDGTGMSVFCSVLDNAALAGCFGSTASSTAVDIYRYDNANYTAGTVSVNVYGFYGAAS